MTNPIDYLYYKVYKGISYMNGGSYPITQMAATCSLLIANYMIVCYLILGEFTDRFLTVGVFLLIVFSLIYFPVKEKRILTKFEQESERSRKTGNRVVVLYIIFTFLSIFLVALL